MKTILQLSKYNDIYAVSFFLFLTQDSEIGILTEALRKHFSFNRLSRSHIHVNATTSDNKTKIEQITSCLCTVSETVLKSLRIQFIQICSRYPLQSYVSGVYC